MNLPIHLGKSVYSYLKTSVSVLMHKRVVDMNDIYYIIMCVYATIILCTILLRTNSSLDKQIVAVVLSTIWCP